MRTIRDCNVAVVGGAGFLGSHVTDYLVNERNCNVLVLDNLVAGRKEFIHPKAKFEHHDITGSEAYLRGIFHQHRIQYVLNYAAYPYVPDSYYRPLRVFEVNATGAIQVINAAQEAGVEGILQVSSAELYGEHQARGEPGWSDYDPSIRETDPIYPHSTYGVAKAAVDHYCQCTWRERGTPVLALRQFNCIGERETHPYVVTEIISQLQSVKNKWLAAEDLSTNTAFIKLGNDSVRDFLYAGDQARLAVELLEKGQWGEVYNLGSESGIRIYHLANLVGQLMGFSGVKVEVDKSRQRKWEIWHLLAANAKIYAAIESRPQVDLHEALQRTIDWYQANKNRWPWEK